MTIKNNIAKKRIKPKKLNFWWLVVISILFSQLLIYTWVRTESTQTILQVSKAQKNFIEKTSYNKALSIERDRLKSDDRITRIAKSRLNLSTDTANQIVYLANTLSGEED